MGIAKRGGPHRSAPLVFEQPAGVLSHRPRHPATAVLSKCRPLPPRSDPGFGGSERSARSTATRTALGSAATRDRNVPGHLCSAWTSLRPQNRVQMTLWKEVWDPVTFKPAVSSRWSSGATLKQLACFEVQRKPPPSLPEALFAVVWSTRGLCFGRAANHELGRAFMSHGRLAATCQTSTWSMYGRFVPAPSEKSHSRGEGTDTARHSYLMPGTG